MPRTIHLCMSIRGALRQTDDELAGMFHDSEKGRDLTGPETREYLLDRLAEGKRVLPCSPDCEGFDYQTGCPGHHTD